MISKRKFIYIYAAVTAVLLATQVAVLGDSVTSLTLVNADTDTDIQQLSEGDTLNLATLPTRNLNVRANTSPATTGSVRFGLDGNDNYQTESEAPYALAGDASGDYAAWTPSVDSHTITATAYTGAGAGGTPGTPLVVNFTVMDNATGMPTANAGPDKNILLPVNSVVLNGGGSDDGTITSYAWTQLSGPGTATLSGQNTATLTASDLIQGTYVMRLTVTDNDSNTDFDEAQIVVSDGSTPPPVDGAFIEDNGLIVIEVESVPVEGDWVEETDRTGFTGTSYYRMNGNTVSSGSPNGRLVYLLQVTNPGQYKMDIHCNKVDVGDTTEANDCYTKMVGHADYQGADCKTYMPGSAETWRFGVTHEPDERHIAPVYDLVAGENQFEVSGRSKHFIIDRIVFWRPDLTGDSAAKNLSNPESDRAGGVYGELKKWHKVTMLFNGPETSESATPNPFTDYRLNVTFTNSGTTYVVPGYYAADGNAVETSATSGNKWRVHFAPDKTGTWNYSVSFRAGSNVAISDDVNGGSSGGYMDGETGSFSIGATDKTGRDNRAKGRLRYVNKHYLQYASSGEYFLKGGSDAPENLLAYDDFDNTPDNGGHRKSWSPHLDDWDAGDPTWKSTKGKGLIGAINYLASKGMNAFSFLTMNIDGDDKNVFPYISDAGGDRRRFDCSKLDQWEIVFEHSDHKGMYLHFKMQETENDQLLDGGDLGNQRKVYYRELIARFSHHLALNWNIGEENTNTDAQRKAFAQYFYDHDPYRHNMVLHTYPGQQDSVYTPMLGSNSKLTGVSLQTMPDDAHSETKQWVTDSANAGKPWIVAHDEVGLATTGVVPDSNDFWHDSIRKKVLWGNLMANGGGVEYYFGYNYAHSDLTCEDFSSRDHMWELTKFALDFFQQYLPYWEMQHNDDLTSASGDYCLAKMGEVYAIYLPSGGTTTLDLTGANGSFSVRWFDPRNGGSLFVGSVNTIEGNDIRPLGNAPNNTTEDWAILVQKNQEGFPLVSITTPMNASTFEAPATVSVTADASDSDGTITNVELYVNDILYDTDTSAPYAWTLSNLAAGSYTLKALAYDNDSQVSDSGPVTITAFNYALTVYNGSGDGSYDAGTVVPVSANAAPGDGTIIYTQSFDGAWGSLPPDWERKTDADLGWNSGPDDGRANEFKVGYLNSGSPVCMGNYYKAGVTDQPEWTDVIAESQVQWRNMNEAQTQELGLMLRTSAGADMGSTTFYVGEIISAYPGGTAPACWPFNTLRISRHDGSGGTAVADTILTNGTTLINTADESQFKGVYHLRFSVSNNIAGGVDLALSLFEDSTFTNQAGSTLTYHDDDANAITGPGGVGVIGYHNINDARSYVDDLQVIFNSDTSGQVFDRWTGDTTGMADIFAADTTITMPAADVTISATYKDSSATSSGTPYSWIGQYYTTNGWDDAQFEDCDIEDDDGDGMSTWQEYIAGTDPTNDASVFAILDLGYAGASNYLTWYGTTNSGVDTPFAIYCATNLLDASAWNFVTNFNRSSTGTNKWLWDQSPPTNVLVFYRIVATNIVE